MSRRLGATALVRWRDGLLAAGQASWSTRPKLKAAGTERLKAKQRDAARVSGWGQDRDPEEGRPLGATEVAAMRDGSPVNLSLAAA